VLQMENGRVVDHCDLATAPQWAKPILLTALKPRRRKGR
jgi:hypothetical protein